MDWLKPCTTITSVDWCSDSLVLDRFTALPVELLIRILSLLPTKDAAATCVLSKRMWSIFPWITTLDFDDFPISHCLERPYAIERLPTFVSFVCIVFRAYQSQHLTRFRLGVGADYMTTSCPHCRYIEPIEKRCFPDLKFTQINAWITFPLTRCGLKELDLRIQKRKPDDGHLPLDIFTCEALEVLKIDVNLNLDETSTIPSFRLPKLTLLHLRVSFISEDGFLTRLVSSCPLLEDLKVITCWNLSHCTNISSPSLRRLELSVLKHDMDYNDDFVLIHTPNLEYFKCEDNLAKQYFIPNMDRLVKADIYLGINLKEERLEVSFQNMLNFIRPLSNVQHLTLTGICIEVLCFIDVTDQLPMFHNLQCLELVVDYSNYWDKLLLAFLRCAPVLGTLSFPSGLISLGDQVRSDYNLEERVLEREFWKTALAIIPSCCRRHLKNIVIGYCYGTEREMDIIKFLLRHALVLEELVMYQGEYSIADRVALESTLQNVPRAVTCSIQVREID